jgi:hypothetical protein
MLKKGKERHVWQVCILVPIEASRSRGSQQIVGEPQYGCVVQSCRAPAHASVEPRFQVEGGIGLTSPKPRLIVPVHGM